MRFKVLTATSVEEADFRVFAPCRAIALVTKAARTSENIGKFLSDYKTDPEDSH